MQVRSSVVSISSQTVPMNRMNEIREHRPEILDVAIMLRVMSSEFEDNAARSNDCRQCPDERIFPQKICRFHVSRFIRIPRQEHGGNVKRRRNAQARQSTTSAGL